MIVISRTVDISSLGKGESSHPAQVSPVQKVTQALCAVPLDDPGAPALLTELEQVRRELVT